MAVVATTISVIISILAGYSLARLRFRGGAAFGTAIFITYLIPPTLLFLPLSQVVVWLGLADSITSLMVTYPTFLVPFCTWLLMGYFRTIPREVEECALVDGASRLQTLRLLKLPSALPHILGGLRIAGGLSLIGAVVAEIAAGSAGAGSGLAYRIAESGYRLNIPRMFAALLLLSLAGIVIHGLLALGSNLLLRRWHESALGSGN